MFKTILSPQSVCTLLVCSIDDDQTRKTLQEVKRVLKPVSNTFVYFTVKLLHNGDLGEKEK